MCGFVWQDGWGWWREWHAQRMSKAQRLRSLKGHIHEGLLWRCLSSWRGVLDQRRADLVAFDAIIKFEVGAWLYEYHYMHIVSARLCSTHLNSY